MNVFFWKITLSDLHASNFLVLKSKSIRVDSSCTMEIFFICLVNSYSFGLTSSSMLEHSPHFDLFSESKS